MFLISRNWIYRNEDLKMSKIAISLQSGFRRYWRLNLECNCVLKSFEKKRKSKHTFYSKIGKSIFLKSRNLEKSWYSQLLLPLLNIKFWKFDDTRISSYRRKFDRKAVKREMRLLMNRTSSSIGDRREPVFPGPLSIENQAK